MPSAPDHPAQQLAWHHQLWRRVCYLWPLKAVGTTAFMTLFFWAYFSVLRNPSRDPWVMPEIWIDHWVPFTPAAFPVYASLWVYVSLPPAMIGNLRGLLRFALWVSLLCLLCLALFWAFPTRVPDFPVDWTQHPSLSFLKGVDASGNACPSLHVASAVFSAYWLHHLFVAMQAPRAWSWISIIFCVAIAWSTLATLQHVALDAIAGAIVGWLFARLSLQRRDLLLTRHGHATAATAVSP